MNLIMNEKNKKKYKNIKPSKEFHTYPIRFEKTKYLILKKKAKEHDLSINAYLKFLVFDSLEKNKINLEEAQD